MPNRPRTIPRPSGADVILEVLSAIVILVCVVILAVQWHALPDRVPTHFDFAGKADAWGGRGGLLFIPAVAIAVYALIGILARFPWTFSYPVEVDEHNAPALYAIGTRLMRALKLAVCLIFACIEVALLRSATLGPESAGLGPIFLPAVVVVLGGIVAWSVVAMKKLR